MIFSRFKVALSIAIYASKYFRLVANLRCNIECHALRHKR